MAVTTIATLPPAKVSEARERLLATATQIFYAEGINTVGVDRIVSDASVTRATFYRHFPSKQDLVLAYLQKVHDAIEERHVALVAAHEPPDVLKALGEDIAAQLERPGFRGCAFINAASEFEDGDGPIRQAVAAHRAWFLGVVRDAFVAAGHGSPGPAAEHFVMLRDGAMVGGHLGDAAVAAETFRRGVDGLLRSGDGRFGERRSA